MADKTSRLTELRHQTRVTQAQVAPGDVTSPEHSTKT